MSPPAPVTIADSLGGRAPQDSTATTLIAILLLTAAATYLGPVVSPILIAAMLYYIIRPAAAALIRRRVPPWTAYLILMVVVVVAILSLSRIVQINISEFRRNLPAYRENLLALIDRLPGDRWDQELRHVMGETFDVSVTDMLGLAFGPAVSFLEAAMMVFFYLIFFMVSAPRIAGRVRRAFDPATADRIVTIAGGISDGIANYMKVKTLVSIGMGLTTAVILYLFGLHYWPLWAVLMCVLNYITYVGSMAALVPPILLAFVQFSQPWAGIALAILLITNRLAWIDYVEIRYSGKSLNVDAVLVLASLAYWGKFWGIVGLVLAVPMLVCVRIVLARIEKTRRWAVLMSDE